MQTHEYSRQYKGAAISIFVHIVALFAGFSVLAAVFEFPEVLRQSSTYRLNLYIQTKAVTQPTYWMLAMTGFTQIAITVFLYRSFRNTNTTVLKFALIFGILAGILQTLGFIRWAILIPYLAGQMANPAMTEAERSAITLIEGAFNRYAGMAIGEHTANICLGLWSLLIGRAALSERLFDKRLAWFGVFVGVVTMSLSMEQLGIAPDVFNAIIDWGFPAWAVWLVTVGIQLLRTDAETGRGPVLDWKVSAFAAALYLGMVLPAVLA